MDITKNIFVSLHICAYRNALIHIHGSKKMCIFVYIYMNKYVYTSCTYIYVYIYVCVNSCRVCRCGSSFLRRLSSFDFFLLVQIFQVEVRKLTSLFVERKSERVKSKTKSELRDLLILCSIHKMQKCSLCLADTFPIHETNY